MERHGEKWDKQEDELLSKKFSSGSSLEDLMRSQRRTFEEITFRLLKLGLLERAGRKWDEQEDELLSERFLSGSSLEDLMRSHRRNFGGITSRLLKLGLLERHGEKWDEQEDELLSKRFLSGFSLADLMRSHRRNFEEITSRSVTLGLIESCPINTLPNAQPLNSKDPKSFDKTKSKSTEEHTKRASSKQSGELTWEYDVKTLHSMGEINNRLYNCLTRLGINDLGFCHEQSNYFFLSKKNFGRRTLRHLREVILNYMVPCEEESQDAEIARPWKSTWEWSGSTSVEISDIIHGFISNFVSLSPRSSEILLLRYGFLGEEKSLTLQAIGKIYGITRERVRQIEKKAKGIIGTRITSGRDREINDLKTICEALFKEHDSEKSIKIVKFCMDFYGSSFAWRAAAFIFLSLKIESDLINAERMALNLLRRAEREDAIKVKIEKNKLKIIALWEKIISRKISPDQPKRFTDLIPQMNGIRRSPNPDSIGIVGEFYSLKLFRNVLFESGMEKKILCYLDSLDDVIWFQEQPTRINYYKKDGEKKSYYPDIAVLDRKNQALVIEVKPLYNMFLFETLSKSLAAIRILNSKGISFVIVDGGGNSICDLAKVSVDHEIEREILNLVDNRVVNWAIYRNEIKGALSMRQLGSIVVRNNLSYSHWPFRLSRITSPNIGFDCFLK